MDDRRLSKRLEQQVRALAAGFDREAARTGFAPSEWRALSVLNDTDGLSLKGLAVRAETSTANASRALSKLVDLGLASWDRISDNRRMYAISITPSGREAYEVAASELNTATRAALGRLSDEELATAVRLLDKCMEGCVRKGLPRSRQWRNRPPALE